MWPPQIKWGLCYQKKMEELILSRQLAASGTSLFQLLQPILWFLEWAPHCTIVLLLCHLLIHWPYGQTTTEPLLCARHHGCEALLSNWEVSWLLESRGHGLFLSLTKVSFTLLSIWQALDTYLVDFRIVTNEKHSGKKIPCIGIMIENSGCVKSVWIHSDFKEPISKRMEHPSSLPTRATLSPHGLFQELGPTWLFWTLDCVSY